MENNASPQIRIQSESDLFDEDRHGSTTTRSSKKLPPYKHSSQSSLRADASIDESDGVDVRGYRNGSISGPEITLTGGSGGGGGGGGGSLAGGLHVGGLGVSLLSVASSRFDEDRRSVLSSAFASATARSTAMLRMNSNSSSNMLRGDYTRRRRSVVANLDGGGGDHHGSPRGLAGALDDHRSYPEDDGEESEPDGGESRRESGRGKDNAAAAGHSSSEAAARRGRDAAKRRNNNNGEDDYGGDREEGSGSRGGDHRENENVPVVPVVPVFYKSVTAATAAAAAAAENSSSAATHESSLLEKKELGKASNAEEVGAAPSKSLAGVAAGERTAKKGIGLADLVKSLRGVTQEDLQSQRSLNSIGGGSTTTIPLLLGVKKWQKKARKTPWEKLVIAQQERVHTEIPRSLYLDLLSEATPMISSTYATYKAQLGDRNPLTIAQKSHLDKLTLQLTRRRTIPISNASMENLTDVENQFSEMLGQKLKEASANVKKTRTANVWDGGGGGPSFAAAAVAAGPSGSASRVSLDTAGVAGKRMSFIDQAPPTRIRPAERT